MAKIIAFLLVIAGAVNWFTIGMLQYDYVAGFFGTQANIFSRIIYVAIGAAGIYIFLLTLFKGGKLTLSLAKAKNELNEKKKEEFRRELEDEYKKRGLELRPVENYNEKDRY